MQAMDRSTRAAVRGREALYEGFDYAAFWREQGRNHLDRLERRVVAGLLPASGRRILDAGCGFGRLVDVYADRFREVVLLDAAWSLLEQARDRWAGRATLVAADLRALPFHAGVFDATVVVRVLHHFEDPSPVLAGLRRVSAPGAGLVFSASNNRNAKRMMSHLLGRRGPSPFAEGPVQYDSASYGWHPRELEGLISRAGFDLRGFRGVGVLDKVAARVGPLGRLVPHGEFLARPLGWTRMAPSLFGSAVAAGAPVADGRAAVGDEEASDAEGALHRDLFRCPACSAAVVKDPGGYRCRRCARRYPLRDGILDFRV